MAKPARVIALALLLMTTGCSKKIVAPDRAPSPSASVTSPDTRVTTGWITLPIQIVDPYPEHIAPALVPAEFIVTWEAPNEGVKRLKYKLFPEEDALQFRADPDSLARRDGPTFLGWDSVATDVRQLAFPGLQIDRRYFLAMVAIDDAGHYTSPFTWNNFLWFQVQPPQFFGSGYLSISTPYFIVRSPTGIGLTGGNWNSPRSLPAHTWIPVHWFNDAYPYRPTRDYRWAFRRLRSPQQFLQEAPRWSEWSLADTSTRLHPLHATGLNERYVLQVQAVNNWGSVTELDVFVQVPSQSPRYFTPPSPAERR